MLREQRGQPTSQLLLTPKPVGSRGSHLRGQSNSMRVSSGPQDAPVGAHLLVARLLAGPRPVPGVWTLTLGR